MNVWQGRTNKYIYKLTKKGDISKFFIDHNKRNKTEYEITELSFPKKIPYGWNNYPFDYYNIWVKNAGQDLFMEEPTLEILTSKYDVIIFKHCYPGSRILDTTGKPDINSDVKTIDNYKLQYNALKEKMHEFPHTKFIVWTPAVCIQQQLTEEQARRTHEFKTWMTEEWDDKGDNIFVWDFYRYETEGGLYLPEKYSASPGDSHPSVEFSARMAPLFCNFIIDVIESRIE